MHALFWTDEGQCLPPFTGAFNTCLFLVIMPLPHSVSHSLHGSHSDITQSTTEKKNHFHISSYHNSACVIVSSPIYVPSHTFSTVIFYYASSITTITRVIIGNRLEFVIVNIILTFGICTKQIKPVKSI